MSLNKAILIGFVGKEPEVRAFDNGAKIATFSLATSDRGYTLANGTVVPERTEWHNIVARGNTVDFIEKWVKKGSFVYIEGKIRTRDYETKDGVRKYVTEIYTERVEFFSSGKKDEKGSEKPQNEPPSESGGSANDLPF